MQHDWNQRAREDAHFYVAFGRRDQDNEEFFATGAEVVAGLDWEMRRLPPSRPRARRALEIGCGPGLYARRLAARFEEIRVVGIDRSNAQLERARSRAARAGLGNCRFELGDATALPHPEGSADAVVLSRLLAVVEDRGQVLAEAHRVLRPGGRCFVAAPRSSLRAGIPIAAMPLASWLGSGPSGPRRAIASADRVEVLDSDTFGALLRSQPWQRLSEWADADYQYAVLDKAVGMAEETAAAIPAVTGR